MVQCKGCMEELDVKNRKKHEMHRLWNPHANELCDDCLTYFIIIGKQPV